MTRATGLSIRLYRWLSHALPEDFLKQHGPEMIATGELTIRDVAAHRGFRGLLSLMFHLVLDLARRLPSISANLQVMSSMALAYWLVLKEWLSSSPSRPAWRLP